MYKAIVFDVDGTMVDTERAFYMALSNLLGEYGMDFNTQQMADIAWGRPRHLSFPMLGLTNFEADNEKLNQYMFGLTDKIEVYDGIADTLLQLKEAGLFLGIVTSRLRLELDFDINPLGLDRFFDLNICAEDTKEHKPHPEPLFTFSEQSGIATSNILFVGDTAFDMHCAKDAGVDFALATWGAKNPEKLTHAKFRLEHPLQLVELINQKK